MDTVPLKRFDFGFLHKSSYPEVDEFPLMQSPIPIALIIVSYIIFVTKIGPAYMKNRKPFNLKNTLIIYNAVQVAYSVYLVARIGRFLSKTGLVYSKCYLEDKAYTYEVLIGIWFYFFAKLTELLDTIFFVLRKKDNQISFLHVYHHIAMLIGTWLFLKYSPSDNIAFLGLVNSFVHVVMYAYYGLAAFGPHMQKYLTWKKYLTTLQLAQFVAQFLVLVAQIYYTECPMPLALNLTVFGNNLFFIYLFGGFYYQNYIKNKSDVLEKKRKSRLD